VNTGILFCLTYFVAVNDLVAKAFGTIFSMCWNFFLKKFWVFSKEEKKKKGATASFPASLPWWTC
jgi:putative flippase GtrA